MFKNKIIVNTTWLLTSQIVSNFISIFAIGFIAQKLGVSGYGELEGALSIAAIFSPIVFAGIQLILVREIIADPKLGPIALGDAITIRILLSPIYFAAVIIFSKAFFNEISLYMAFLAAFNFFIVNFLQSFTIACEASEQMHYMAIGGLLSTIVGIILSIFAVNYNYGSTGVMVARIFGQLAQGIYIIAVVVSNFYMPKFNFNFASYGSTLKKSLPLAISFAASLMLLRIDQSILMFFKGKTDVGFYSCATELAYKLEMVIIAVQIAITPALIKAWKRDQNSYISLIEKSIAFVMLISMPIAVGTLFIADDLIMLLFKEEFLPSGTVLKIIIIFLPFQFANRVHSVSIAARGKEKTIFYAVTFAVVANIILNLFLIPKYSYKGAAASTVITEIILFVIYSLVQKEFLLRFFKSTMIIKIIASVAVMGIACFYIQSLHFIAIIFIAAIVYLIAIMALKCTTISEVKEFLITKDVKT